MKRVTAFVGSARKKNTYHTVVQFLNDLQALGDVEYEIVTLHDYTLKFCRGCEACIRKGEEFCPLKDDRDVLMDKIGEAGLSRAIVAHACRLQDVPKHDTPGVR